MLGLKTLVKTLVTAVSRVLKFINDARLKKAGADEERVRQVEQLKRRKRVAQDAINETLTEARKDELDQKYTPMD